MPATCSAACRPGVGARTAGLCWIGVEASTLEGRGHLGAGHGDTLLLTHRATLEREAVAVVHESIEDGIGERGFVDIGVPLLDRQLTGDERGLLVVTIVEDFEQVAFVLIAERREPEVVDVEQVNLGQLAQECGAIGLRVLTDQFVDQARHAIGTHRVIGTTGCMRQRAGDVALADAARRSDQHIEFVPHPTSPRFQ